MRPLTQQQRSGYLGAAGFVAALGVAAILSGLWVGATNPFGVAYGAVGVLAGLVSLAIAFAIALVARRAPAA